MADKRVVMRALEPAEMSVPAMDRPSLVLAWFMDNIVVESEVLADAGAGLVVEMYLTCKVCTERICEIEDGDTLRVLFNTALAHGC